MEDRLALQLKEEKDMISVDVLFLSNVIEKIANNSKKMSVEEAMKLMVVSLRTGVREFQEGHRDTLYSVGIQEGKIMGDKR